MTSSSDATTAEDQYNLNRFLQAQEEDYERALSEIRSGRKRTHWMWYIFPQLDGLAFSSTAKHYAIRNVDEARAYLAHPRSGATVAGVCRGRCPDRELLCQRDLRHPGRPETAILRNPVRSRVAPRFLCSGRLLEKYYAGQRDDKTLELLRTNPETGSHLQE
jgi:uncharacterized protein (DUF1810 family)